MFWVSRSNIRRADLFLFYFHSGIQQFSRNYERNNMYLGRCKLSRPGSQWGEKGFHPFPKQISCSQVTRKKKNQRAVVCGTPFLPPFPPPPHYGAWSQANVNCRRVVVCRFFWGAFGAGREGESCSAKLSVVKKTVNEKSITGLESWSESWRFLYLIF